MPFFNLHNQLYWDLEALSHEKYVDLEDRRSVLDGARQHDRQALYAFLRLYPERFPQLKRDYNRWRIRNIVRVREQAHKKVLVRSGGYGVLDKMTHSYSAEE